MTIKTTIWRLKSGSDRRFRAGHPWVYSNELQVSPKGLPAGAPVEICDAGGKFLARGYGNPSSLIAFRALSRDPEVADPAAPEVLAKTLWDANVARRMLGWSEYSHRLCFAEADSLPGLIIDRYRLVGGQQVFVIQAHTAGMDQLLPAIVSALEALVEREKGDLSKMGVVIKNDVAIRKLEGLEEETPRIHKDISGAALDSAEILVRPAIGEKPVVYGVDLVRGQKTGFFLDQVANVSLAAERLRMLRPSKGKQIRILDLCSYVGQWSAQMTRLYRAQGLEVETTLVDASAKALELARANASREGAQTVTLKGDVLKDLAELPDRSFDLVISDPPALIQGRKDIPVGTHAYLQLNTQVMRLVRDGGGIVSCSCSALLNEEDFVATLAKAARRQARKVRWVGRGGQAPDHPVLAEFPEGRYLKAWIGLT